VTGRERLVIHGATTKISQLISRTTRDSNGRFIGLPRAKLSNQSTVRQSSYRACRDAEDQ